MDVNDERGDGDDVGEPGGGVECDAYTIRGSCNLDDVANVRPDGVDANRLALVAAGNDGSPDGEDAIAVD